MTPAHFWWMVRAEARKVFTRGVGMATVGASVLVAVLTTLMLQRVDNADSVRIMDQSLGEMVSTSAVGAAGWALWTRNFFVLPMFLILATATAIASEHADRTLREVLVRPVPRWAVLATRLVALTALAAASLGATLVTSLAMGVPMFGFPEPGPMTPEAPGLGAVLLGYAVAVLSDVALIVLTMALCLVVRSAGLVVVGLATFLMIDFGAYGVLLALSKLEFATAQALQPFTLWSAMHAWQGWELGWTPEPFLVLALYTALAGGFAVARFRRLDVP